MHVSHFGVARAPHAVNKGFYVSHSGPCVTDVGRQLFDLITLKIEFLVKSET